MKSKKEGAYPEIIVVDKNICFGKFRNKTKYRRAKKIHHRQKCNADKKIDEQEKIQECFRPIIAFLLPDAHAFGNQHRGINTVDEAREQNHSCKNKKVDISFYVAAKIPGNNDA